MIRQLNTLNCTRKILTCDPNFHKSTWQSIDFPDIEWASKRIQRKQRNQKIRIMNSRKTHLFSLNIYSVLGPEKRRYPCCTNYVKEKSGLNQCMKPSKQRKDITNAGLFLQSGILRLDKSIICVG